MKAAVFHGPGDLRVSELPRPSISEHEILLKIAACAVCGSDVRTFRHGARNIDRIKALQEELGVIHDIDVRIELIRSELLAQNETQLDSIIEELMTASKTTHRAILTSALRPPPDDPRRGLYALLGRQMLDRRERYRAFITLWNEFEGAGMRSDLVQMTWDSSRASATKDAA